MRILFVSAEVAPIAKTGGLGDVCGSLPKALAARAHEPFLFMPFHRQAREWFERSGAALENVLSLDVSWAGWSAEATLLRSTLPGTDIPLYLIANDHFFDRESIYGFRADGYDDGFERFLFFSRAVIDAAAALDLRPEIVHAHDWHTALLPLYLHSGLRNSESFAGSRSVYTIHNLNYQGVSRAGLFGLTGLPSRYWAADALEHFGELNPMKGAILLADQVTTVSPNYAREIQTPAFGAGLDGVLRSVAHKLSGILNGIDVEEWDPSSDPHIASNYDGERLGGKSISKRALLKELRLPYRARTPLLAAVSRLVDQKGFQLLAPVLGNLLQIGAQAVVLGSGDPLYERAFSDVAAVHAASCRVEIGFDAALAHRIYAGADILLMPSMYEPCGLNQMYALRYGTIPVVRMTGGLADTVLPFDGTNADVANGFAFDTPAARDLYAATWIAILNYREGRAWKRLQQNGMRIDFSWERSARGYEVVYEKALAS